MTKLTAVFVRCHRWENFWRYFRIIQMLRECRLPPKCNRLFFDSRLSTSKNFVKAHLQQFCLQTKQPTNRVRRTL